jgi:excisionase family DNA binding protein
MNKSKEKVSSETKLLLTIAEVSTMLGVGRTKVYALIRQDGLPTVRLGRGILRVSLTSLQKWIQQRENQSIT